jgi:GT2 family glycosyltransferase
VIPVHNGFPLTRACLESLAAAGAVRHLEVVVVDNASSDETPGECPVLGQALFGAGFVYVRFEENVNFGPACNHGARIASGRYLFLQNNDTVARPGWEGPLLRELEHDPALGAVGPLLLYPGSKRVQHAGIVFSPFLEPLHYLDLFPGDHPTVAARRRVQAVSAAAVLLRREEFLELGGFHPGYANGYEDLDFCARLAASGKRMTVASRSVILHHAEQSPGRHDQEEHNARLFRERCRGMFDADLHRQAVRDGFVPGLTPWQSVILRLPGDREARLEARAAGCGAGQLEAMLCREPLWESGYGLWLSALERESGPPDEVMKAAYLAARFFPSPEACLALHHAARRAGAPGAAADALARLEHILNVGRDTKWLTERAGRMLAAADQAGDEVLAGMFAGWLADHGPA